MKALVSSSVAFAALLYAPQVLAQAATSADTAGLPVSDDGTTGPDGNGDDDSTPIVVTAQGREQKLQDVPIAVSAFRGESLEKARITSITSLQTATPSLVATTSNRPATSASFTLRGIGTSGSNAGLESAVGFSVDGVFRSRSGAGLGDFVDIGSIEVLRGPQGTLFGKNTTAGVVQITSRNPDLNEIDGFIEGTYGNHDLVRVRAAANLPFAPDTAALRVSFGYHKRNGFIQDPVNDSSYNDRDRFTLAGKLLLKLGLDIEALIAADYSEADEACCQFIRFSTPATAPAYIPFLAARAASRGFSYPVVPDFDRYDTVVNLPVVNSNVDRGTSLQLNAPIGNATLTTISSYRKFTDLSNNDLDFTGAEILRQIVRFRLSSLTQEVRLKGDAFDERLDWLVGAYYSREKIGFTEIGNFGVDADAYFTFLSPVNRGYFLTDAFFGTVSRQKSDSFALFTHNIVNITDQLRFTGGLRWTKETKHGTVSPFEFNTVPQLPRAGVASLNVVSIPYDETYKDDAFSGTAVIDYRWTPDIMTYASYSHGYKAGGLSLAREAAGPVFLRNAACSATQQVAAIHPTLGPVYRCDARSPLFRPETVDSYEIGVRSQFFDRRVTLNFTLFQADYKDLQLNLFSGPTASFRLANAGTARTRGVEIDTNVRIAQGFSISANAGYLDTEFGAAVPSLVTGEPVLAGQPLANAPKYSGAIRADIDRDVSDSVSVYFRPEVYYRASTFSSTRLSSFRTVLKLPAITLLNASAGVRFDEKWELSAFCRNCADKRYPVVLSSGVAQPGVKDALPGDPAEYGISARFNF